MTDFSSKRLSIKKISTFLREKNLGKQICHIFNWSFFPPESQSRRNPFGFWKEESVWHKLSILKLTFIFLTWMTNSNTAVLKSTPLCFFVLFCTFALILAHFKISDYLSHIFWHTLWYFCALKELWILFFKLIERCCSSETSLKCDMVLFFVFV